MALAIKRDVGTFFSVTLNNLFLFAAWLAYGAIAGGMKPAAALPFFFLLLLITIFPLSSDPLAKVPPDRRALWPLTQNQRIGLRLASLALSPILWIGLAVLLTTRGWGWALVFLLVALAAQIEAERPWAVASGGFGAGTAVAPALAKPKAEEEEAIAESPDVVSLGLANAKGLEALVTGYGVRSLVVRSESIAPELASALTRLRFQGVRMYPLPEFYMKLTGELPLEMLSDAWLSFAEGFDVLNARLLRRVKRLMDMFLASVGLLLSVPILLVAAIAIKIDSRGPVLLRQGRVGWMGIPFKLLKLRSMNADAESDGRPQWASMGDPRITRVGRILRKFRIDEIPQLINVLRGEMSFVGPRPERPEFMAELTACIPFNHLRHYVTPGITGWAQVMYPYGACVQDARRKLQFDLCYIRNASPFLDLRIVLRTASVVLFSNGSR